MHIRVQEHVCADALLGSLQTIQSSVVVAGHVAQKAAPEVTHVAIVLVETCTRV